jgi:large subunit ribosomal protein L33
VKSVLSSVTMLSRSAFLGNAACRVSPAPAPGTGPRQVTCMAKKKGVRCIITVECTEARGLGETPSRYTTQKNKKNNPERLEIRKYNKYLKRMTVHKEIK